MYYLYQIRNFVSLEVISIKEKLYAVTQTFFKELIVEILAELQLNKK